MGLWAPSPRHALLPCLSRCPLFMCVCARICAPETLPPPSSQLCQGAASSALQGLLCDGQLLQEAFPGCYLSCALCKLMELERWGVESLGPALPCLDGGLRPGGVEVNPGGKTTCPQETQSGQVAAPVTQWSWGRQAFWRMPINRLLILVRISRFCLYEKYT